MASLSLRVLVADDEPVSRTVVTAILRKAGYDVVQATDGAEALHALQSPDAPLIAVIDWMMPQLDGVEICRRLRSLDTETPLYVVLLTSRGSSDDVVTGLHAGADDYVTKPAHAEELLARVNVGARVVRLRHALSERVQSLQEALSKVKQLQGLLPICSYCKRIRDDQNYWQQVEGYISQHTDVKFSHSYCPECLDHHVLPQRDALEQHLK